MDRGPGFDPASLDEEAHVWLVRPAEIRAEAKLDEYLALLSEEERRQYERFHFDEHRDLYLVARALVRTTLSKYLEGHPRDWTFQKNEHGRPELAATHAAEGLRFNLSHARGLAGMVVARSVDCGFDVEDANRLKDPLALIERFFAPQEVAALRALPADRRATRFFQYWTLKESYIKARGMGLAIPLRSFWFQIDEGAPVRIGIDPEQKDDPSTWQFHSERREEGHFMAVALRSAHDPLRIQTRLVIP